MSFLIGFHGNQHHSAFLFAPDPLFDFFDPHTPDLLAGATLVPRRLVKAFFDQSLDQLRALLPRLFAAGCRSVRLVGTPPPKSDIHAFGNTVRESHVAQAFARRTGRDVQRACSVTTEVVAHRSGAHRSGRHRWAHRLRRRACRSHTFHNFSLAAVSADLDEFILLAREINPSLRFILTVSPVPLVATATGDHVLTGTTYSEAVLRVAAAEAANKHADVIYFLAYEIVTGPRAPYDFFEADRR
jgi:GSCFA family